MSCARCAELEEEIAYLKGELGIRADAEVVDRIRRGLLTVRIANSGGKHQAAECLAALYAAKGRTVSPWNLMSAVPGPSRLGENRTPNIVTVWIHMCRRLLGREAIENVYGKGYRLTPAGMARVTALIRAPAP
jgi:DNA-binding winged helix-turn-helix (wHTH) protein